MMFKSRSFSFAIALVGAALFSTPAALAEGPRPSPDAAGVAFFEKHVRPVLVENCYKCHSAEAKKAGKLKGDLLLDTRTGVLQGGENGPVIAPGNPDKSLLIKAVRYTDDDLKMPPKTRLAASAVADLEKWVAMGAPDPRQPGAATVAAGDEAGSAEAVPWVFQPIVRPEVPAPPAGAAPFANPIDAFIAANYEAHGLKPVRRADPATLLRRVYLDLVGLPPSPAELEAFLRDPSPESYEKVVDRLLASEQHGVRYGRHWLDVLRYADSEERMVAAPGIYLWRDWVIRALNDDLPYDQFVRAQLTGYRSSVRTEMSATGFRSRSEPRPDDLFALGLLARGDVIRDGKETRELPIAAVETVSTAFMGMTVGCAKCHNHKFDPIKKRDFYAMKALFDPLTLRKVTLATPAELFAQGKVAEENRRRRAAVEASIDQLVGSTKRKLYDDRVAMLPPDVQAVIRKPENQRTAAEQKIADNYFPVLRIDADKVAEVLSGPVRGQYQKLLAQLNEVSARTPPLPAFWAVEVDPTKEREKSYVLTSGDPDRPELDHEVSPGWPFAPPRIDFRDGRIEAFSDWLTAPDNAAFARVAVNRLWQWHFGQGIQKSPSDFGKMGGTPSDAKLLDWLASEFVRRGFSMKQMHRLMVTSETYKLASSPLSDPSDSPEAMAAAKGLAKEDEQRDPEDTYLWRFRLLRLEAEPVWDSIFTAAGNLDLTVGGRSFDLRDGRDARGEGAVAAGAGGQSMSSAADPSASVRRAAYMVRGFSTSRDVVPAFLQTFDVDDGRVPCPVRTRTVTAPQALFLMNSGPVQKATQRFADRLRKESAGDLAAAVELAYRVALTRPPTQAEKSQALSYLDNDPARLKGLAWLLFNLDEFTYVR